MEGVPVQRSQNHSTSPTGEPARQPLVDLPVPPYVTAQDVQFATRAVMVHAPEEWPAGTVCRNDRSPFPCQLHRWGRMVLAEHGLSDAEIDEVARRRAPVGRPPAARRPVPPAAAPAARVPRPVSSWAMR